jgi:hypothetical protein
MMMFITRRGVVLGVSGFLAGLIVLTTWSVVSPVGSDPDGSFHLNSIWCGQGTRLGMCEDPPPGQENTAPKTIQTPVGVSAAGQCFSGRPLDSAVCENGTINGKTLVPNQFNNEGRLYPNGYYWVASHFVGDNVVLSAMLVRWLNIGLLMSLLILLGLVAEKAVFRSVLTSLVVMWVPLGFFLVASNNGSSWTLTGVGLFWAFFWTVLRSTSTRVIGLSILGAILTAAMAMGSRTDGAIYVALSAAVILFMTWKQTGTPSTRKFGVAAVAVVIAAASAVYTTSGQSGALTGGLYPGGDFGRSAADVLWVNSLRLPGFFLGIYGLGGFGGGLGWLDTPTEALTWAVMGAVLVALVSRSRTQSNGRYQLGLVFMVAMSIVIPMYMLFVDRAFVIENVQARYVLPLLTVAFALLVLPTQQFDGPWSLTVVSRSLLSAAITVAHAIALHTNMRRYISGLDVISPNLNNGREWWPNWLLSPNFCWFAGALSMGVVTYLLFFHVLGNRPITTSANPEGVAEEGTDRLQSSDPNDHR